MTKKMIEEQERLKREQEDKERKALLDEIQRKKDEKKSTNPYKEQRAAVEASRKELKDKVALRLKKMIEDEEFKALKKSLDIAREYVETAEEKAERERATLEEI